MANGCISIERILNKLDGYFNQNDYPSAEKHLLYWLSEALANDDARTALLMRNELMGLYRKLGKKDEALDMANAALALIENKGIGHQVGAATSFLNAATVYKAFSMAEQALPLFERARAIYEKELSPDDTRLGGLYNNMALALVDLRKYEDADLLYRKALLVMEQAENGAPEVAITYLNMATAAEAEQGLADADERIQAYLEKARTCLDAHPVRDGYYAFVCEKCASVFGYYGHFIYEEELKERAKVIYEGN